MKKNKMFFVLLLVLLLLTACSNKISTSVEPTIPLLIHLDTGNSLKTYLGNWNLSKHSITLDDELYQSETSRSTHPLIWDGKNKFVIEGLPADIKKDDLIFSNELVKDGYLIQHCQSSTSITQSEYKTGTIKTLNYIDDNGRQHSSKIPNVSPPKEYKLTNIVLEEEIFYAAYKNNMLYAFFSIISPDGLLMDIYCLSYIPDDSKTGIWTRFTIDSKALGVLWYQDVVFNDNKLYISLGNDIAVLNVSTGEVHKLTKIVEKAHNNIVPNSTQVSFAGSTIPIRVNGVWDDIVVFYLPSFMEDNIDHAVYVAFKKGKPLGAIDITNNTIITYDNSFKRKQTCLNNTKFLLTSISLPKE